VADDAQPRRSTGGDTVGIVREVLPHAMYRVELDNRHSILAHAPGGPGRNFVRIVVGDRVRLELSPVDLSRGRITKKLAQG
jgi:translation initiation factor IF-1